MEVQLHGLGLRMFQFEKEEGGGVGEVCSHENRIEASWFAAAAKEGTARRRVDERRVRRKRGDGGIKNGGL